MSEYSTFETASEIALTYPEVVVTTAYGTPALRAGKKFMARLKEDGDTFAIHIDPLERDMLLENEPEIYYLTEHYINTPYVLIRLSKIHPDDLRTVIERAWRKLATKRAIKAYETRP